MISWPKTIIKRLNTWQIEALLLLLLSVIVLRIPSLIEPYWYGDEATYLTIGTALRHGSQLYLDIIDHKTPLIYYLAMTPTQVWFRVLLLGWILFSTIAFYVIATRLFKNLLTTVIASLFFVLLTSLPALEGNIPNGELFMMGFVLVGGALLTRLPLWDTWQPDQNDQKSRSLNVATNRSLLLAAGAFFGLGILTKAPAVFDLLGWLSLGWFSTFQTIPNHEQHTRKSQVAELFQFAGWLGLGAAAVVFGSVLYFFIRGAGAAYIEYGLVYNFRYASFWSPDFTLPALAVIFSLPFKILFLVTVGLLLTFISKKVRPHVKFFSFWLLATVVAATLSHRPYPHYFLQLIPPLALAIGGVAQLLQQAAQRQKLRLWLSQLLILVLPIAIVAFTWQSLGFQRYPTLSYYQNFGQLITGGQSYQQYAQRFNYLVSDNQRLTEILATDASLSLFIWGNNPLLYAQTRTIPTSRFTTAFHINDFNDYDQTLMQVQTQKPNYIVVMNEEANSFPALNYYLENEYLPNRDFDTLVLWRKWKN